MRVGGQTLARVATLTDSHQLSSSFDRAFTGSISAHSFAGTNRATALRFEDRFYYVISRKRKRMRMVIMK